MADEDNGNLNNSNNNQAKERPPESTGLSSVQIVNVIIAIILVVAVIFLAWRFINPPEEDKDQPLPPKTENQPKLPTEGIINAHEHIQTYNSRGDPIWEDLGQRWLEAMERVNVSCTAMLGSPDATFFLKPTGHFNNYDRSNEDVVKLAYYFSDNYEGPTKYIAFPTVNATDPDNLAKFQDLMDRGAWGLKLYSGHYASFHSYQGPLNISSMYPIYQYCQDEQIPIIWHVHLGKKHIQAEFEAVLKDFPDLIINVPHWGLRSSDLPTLEDFLDTYENLYTDVSFGAWAMDGFVRVSDTADAIKAFVEKYPDRILFATDMVYTEHQRKTVEWAANLTQAYIDMLEKDYYSVTVATEGFEPDVIGDHNGMSPGDYTGLNLDQDILEKIYYDNSIKFLLCKPYNEEVNISAIKAGEDIEQSRGQAEGESAKRSMETEIFETIVMCPAIENRILMAIDS